MKHAKLSTTLLFLTVIIASCSKEKVNNKQSPVVSTPSISEIINSDKGLKNSVLAYYSFNGNTLDSSGNGNNVIFNNATPTTDRFGNENGAYLFNGTDNYMRVANSATLNPTHGITMFAIVKVNGFYQGQCHGNRIINKNLFDTNEGSYNLNFDDGYFYNYNHCSKKVKETKENFSAGYGNGQLASIGGIDTADNIKTDKWYVLAFTYDGTVANFYINGELKSTNTASITFTPNTYDLFFGATSIYNTQYPYWFNGVIDDIAIFDAALTETQIKKLAGNL